MKRILLAAVVGGGGMYFVDHYHVVNSVDGLVVVPRAQQVPLRTAYADVRGWDATKWAEYPELSESLLQAGRAGLIVDSAADGLLNKIGEQLGLSSPSTSNPPGTAVNDLPVIVFGAPASKTSIPAAATPTDDDSLLGRLSRQLQGSTTTQPAATIESRPLFDAVSPTPRQSPTQPAFQPTYQPTTNERAGLSPGQLSEDLLPSIHSAAMQRITNEITGNRAALESGWTPTPDSVPTNIRDVADSLLRAPNESQSQFGNFIPARSPSQSASGSTPLEIDAERLRQSLPATIQQNLLRSLQDQPSAGLDSVEFKSF